MQVQNNHNLQAQNLNGAGNQENPVDPNNVVPADPYKLREQLEKELLATKLAWEQEKDR